MALDAPFGLFTLVLPTLPPVCGETLGRILLMGLMLALVWNVTLWIEFVRRLEESTGVKLFQDH